MSAVALQDWLALVVSTDAPALPGAVALQIWRHLGWSVVLACLGAALVGRWCPAKPGRLDGRQWAVALLLGLWAWMPGPFGPTYWLGLAFQSPSVVAVLLCDALLRYRFFSTRAAHAARQTPNPVALTLALMGVVLGWALLLDTFALLPVSLYAWGFSPLATVVVLCVALLAWVVAPGPIAWTGSRLWVVPVAVLVFVGLRLPSGNVWDAVLDPWLWLVLHGVVAGAALGAWRLHKGQAAPH